MRKRPLLLFICALAYLYFPIEFAVRYLRGASPNWTDISLSVIFPIVLAFGLIRVARFGWYTLIAFGVVWGIKDLYSYYSYSDSPLAPVIMHLLVYLFSLAYFINPRIRLLYFDPKKRWWRTRRRFETHAPAMVCHAAEWSYPLLRNISQGGCFVETVHPLSVGSAVDVGIPLPIPLNVSVIKVKGVVRWVSKNPSQKGMGIQFITPPKRMLKAIRSYVRRHL